MPEPQTIPATLPGPWGQPPRFDPLAALAGFLEVLAAALRGRTAAPPEPPPGPVSHPRLGPRLTKLDRQILDVATAAPQMMGQLARACDHDSDSYFRERVRRLVTLG